MQRTRHFGGLLVVLATLGLSAAGPAQAAPAASVSLTPSGVAPAAVALEASGAATSRSAPAAACAPGATACPIRITFGPGAYSGQAHAQLTGIRSARVVRGPRPGRPVDGRHRRGSRTDTRRRPLPERPVERPAGRACLRRDRARHGRLPDPGHRELDGRGVVGRVDVVVVIY